MRRCHAATALTAVVMLWLMPAAALPAAPEPSAEPVDAAAKVVTWFHSQLNAGAAMEGDVTQRYQRLLPAVEQAFHVETIARLSLGRAWRSLDRAMQNDFARALHELIAATYAQRFVPGTRLDFEVLDSAHARRGPLIRTQLVRQSGVPVSLDYHFRSGKIYNVVADGVSDLSLRRADYNTVIKQQGYAALLEHVRAQRLTLLQQ